MIFVLCNVKISNFQLIDCNKIMELLIEYFQTLSGNANVLYPSWP